jgi:hypothetical protein
VTTGQLPEGRYGPRGSRPRARWVRSLGMVLAALVGLAVAVVGYHNFAEAPVDSRVLGFSLRSDNAVELRFEVLREDPERPAVCIVRARSRDGEETGRKEVYVPPAGGPVELTTVIITSRPPVTADVYGCSLQIPPYLVPGHG